MFPIKKYSQIALFISLLMLLGESCYPSYYHRPYGGKGPDYLKTSTRKIYGIYHTIKPGETLWRIAKTYHVNIQELSELNNIKNVTKIKTGQKVFIPGSTNIRKVPKKWKTAPSPLPSITKKKTDFMWPVKGKVVSGFGINNGLKHEGIEIAAPLGAPVKAAKAGEVVYEGRLQGYGNMLILKHKNYFHTIYAYTHKNLVSVGGKVKKGQTIARVGTSGRTSQPRLFFQIRKSKKARNPLFFLP